MKLIFPLLVLFSFFIEPVNAFWKKADDLSYDFNGGIKNIRLIYDGMFLGPVTTRAGTVSDFLNESGINTSDRDLILPERNSLLYNNSSLLISIKKSIAIYDKEEELLFETFSRSIDGVLWENNIDLDEHDIITPPADSLLSDGSEVEIVRVDIREESEEEEIDHKTVAEEDDEMGWREKKILQKGKAGLEKITYEVVYHNGKELSRKKIGSETIEEPVREVVRQGTNVKLGKKHSGLGTWYAYKGGLFAASPWLPMGSYAKVTNKANGKSVIVQINDRGPFGENRIIDLDKVAFAKIASIGAGVIDVRVEEVLN